MVHDTTFLPVRPTGPPPSPTAHLFGTISRSPCLSKAIKMEHRLWPLEFDASLLAFAIRLRCRGSATTLAPFFISNDNSNDNYTLSSLALRV
jgi:hypothetical protein